MGLAFHGFKERTAQSKAEARRYVLCVPGLSHNSLSTRRRGEVVSEDEDEDAPRKTRSKGKGTQQPRSDAWKKPKKTKVKVEHQTYEQIVQNAGQEAGVPGIGKIYDATSGEVRIHH